MHGCLYGWQNERIMLIQTAAHLAEEVGEVSKALRHKDRAKLCEEMADVASWIFGLATRLNLDLETIVWECYPYECEKCHHTECRCKQKEI